MSLSEVENTFNVIALRHSAARGYAYARLQTSYGDIVSYSLLHKALIACSKENLRDNIIPVAVYFPQFGDSKCFLVAADELENSSRLSRINYICSMGLKENGLTGEVSLYHPKDCRWLSAGPVSKDETFVRLASDRITINDWEKFNFFLIDNNNAHHEGMQRRLTDLAGKTLFDLVRSASQHEAPLIEAAASIRPLDDISDLAQKLLRSESDCAHFAALFPNDFSSTQSLPHLRAWTSQKRDRQKSWRAQTNAYQSRFLGPDLDRIASCGINGEYVSLAHACASLAREAVVPEQDICIVATARNEGLYLLEWIAYHKSIGIKQFFLYSNNNDDGSDSLLAALAQAGEIRWKNNVIHPGASAQLKAYKHAFSIEPEILKYRWALTIDLDEYLVVDPKNFKSLSSFLARHDAIGSDAIALNWVIHGPGAESHWRDDFIGRRFPYAIGLDNHIKTMSRPSRFMHSKAHHPVRLMDRPYRFNKASGAPHDPQPGHEGMARSQVPEAEVAWINHYFFKSCQEFLWKWSRNRGDHSATFGRSNTALTENFVKDFVAFSKIRNHAAVTPEMAAPNYDNELRRLVAVRGVSDAWNSIKGAYSNQINDIVAMFRNAPGILGAGDEGAEFFKLLAGDNGNP